MHLTYFGVTHRRVEMTHFDGSNLNIAVRSKVSYSFYIEWCVPNRITIYTTRCLFVYVSIVIHVFTFRVFTRCFT